MLAFGLMVLCTIVRNHNPLMLTCCVVAVCGNMLCEYGEECYTAGCSDGCPLDCPASSSVQCPTGMTASGTRMACSGRGLCTYATNICRCYVGYTGAVCAQCAAGYFRLVSGGPCVMIPGSQSSCNDGLKNGNEKGVDCGGPNCPACNEQSFLSAGAGTVVVAVWLVAGVVFVVVGVIVAYRRVTQRSIAVQPFKLEPAPVSHQAPKDVPGTPAGPRKVNATRVAPIQVRESDRDLVNRLHSRANLDAHNASFLDGTSNLALHWSKHDLR